MHHHWQHAAVKQTNVLFLFSRRVIFFAFSFYFFNGNIAKKSRLITLLGKQPKAMYVTQHGFSLAYM
jgi:hypothetical protein